uniref:Ubiquinone biosynthesis accessory factor UbiK n=1 Tax=mine drainage metagenome TaxID=410659 RepID=E6QTZ2_9ZZZZ
MLLNQKLIDDISDKISQTLNHGPVKDLEHNLRALLQSLLQKLDLVTREEFDVQQQVLVRTREQLVALEVRVAALESAAAPLAAETQAQHPRRTGSKSERPPAAETATE